jgi:hypothetical protein
MAVTIMSKNPAKGATIRYSGQFHSGLEVVARCVTLATRAKGKKACKISAMYFRSIAALPCESTGGLPLPHCKPYATLVSLGIINY